MFKNVLSNKRLILMSIFSILFLIGFYLLLYKIYAPFVNSFGCFDECMNIGGGYFMTQGRALFSQAFFNHQPFMGYISYFIQMLTNPQNIYELLLRHLQFMFIFGFIFSTFLIIRFGKIALGFVVIYELSKFYLFGNKFLGESYVVYPMSYMLGLVWYKLNNKKTYYFEYILAGLFTWFTLFTREPFSITVLFQYALILGVPKTKYKKVSIILFIILSTITVMIQPLEEYYFSVVTVSSKGTLMSELSSNLFGAGLLNIFFYPFSIVIGEINGRLNEFWMLLSGISISFIILSMYLILVKKKYFLVAVIYLILGFSNIRYLDIGDTFFRAFHLIPWFGMIIFISLLIIRDEFKPKSYPIIASLLVLLGSFSLFLINPSTFFKHPADPHFDLLVGYGKDMNIGGLVNVLSNPDQTFFIDKIKEDDSPNLAYWQSKRKSAYKYGWYTYFAPGHKRYEDARTDMLKNNPPDFYYSKNIDKLIKNDYVNIYHEGKPVNLYINKKIYDKIASSKWDLARQKFNIDR